MISIDGIGDVLKRLDNLQQLKRVKAAVRESAVFLRGKLAKYPRVSRRRNLALYGNTDRARRMRAGFFWHLKNGDIDVPYYRGKSRGSEKLGQSWTIEQPAGTLKAIVGTNVSYAPLVQDRDEQSTYHRQTGWVTAQGVVNLYGAEVTRRIEQAIQDEVKKGLT